VGVRAPFLDGKGVLIMSLDSILSNDLTSMLYLRGESGARARSDNQMDVPEFNDGHTTHPLPEAWLKAHPCPAKIDAGCQRCWIDYTTSLALEAIEGLDDDAA